MHALLVLCLLVLLHLVLVLRLHSCLMLLFHMLMPHPCMMHGIQLPVLVRVPGRGEVPKLEVAPAENFRLVSEVEAGVNFGPAGQARRQVAVHSSGRRPGPGTRWSRGCAVTLSIHLESPVSQFVSPGRGLGIRQSMGWRKVCGAAGSGIWVPKGDIRGRMVPANLDH